MTYCVGLRLERGLVFMSDTRTNAGVDDFSTVTKLHSWEVPGERSIVLMTAGNLATTQALVSLLNERTLAPDDRDISLMSVPTMFQAARLIGRTLREVIAENANTGPSQSDTFNATLILGGQIAGMPPRLFMIYPEGNFIEAQDDTPFFQIGETKYGRPILVRAQGRDMSFEEAVRLLLVSFDSTIKANLSVGLPLDVCTLETDVMQITGRQRIRRDDPYFHGISKKWGEALGRALDELPDFTFTASTEKT